MLSTRNLTRVLSSEAIPVTLVNNISIDIGQGEFVAITGPSGSGKSSLLYLLGLLDDPTTGEVYVENQKTSSLKSRQKARLRLEKLGYIFQFHFLLPEFSVLENVMLPMDKLGALPQAQRKDYAMDILQLLDIGQYPDKKPGQLSGGQRQRVAIARALANNPQIILADEPTGNLDSKNAAIVFDIFERLAKEQGRTVVTVTHDNDLAERCQRRIHIVDGMIPS